MRLKGKLRASLSVYEATDSEQDDDADGDAGAGLFLAKTRHFRLSGAVDVIGVANITVVDSETHNNGDIFLRPMVPVLDDGPIEDIDDQDYCRPTSRPIRWRTWLAMKPKTPWIEIAGLQVSGLGSRI